MSGGCRPTFAFFCDHFAASRRKPLRSQFLHPSESETIDRSGKYCCMNAKTDTPLDINAMALFARVLQHGSLSEASRRLGVPVSTVSRKISALESQLGVRLLDRTTRAISPTETASAFLPPS